MANDPGGLSALARERFANRDYYGALLSVDELIASGRAWADAYHLRGLALTMLERTSEALTAFDQALKLNPQYLEAHIHRGLLLNQLGRTGEAVSAFESAAASGGSPVDGMPAPVAGRLANEHARLGELYAEAGSLTGAVEQYRRSVALGPTFLDIRLRLARLLMESGNPLAAEEELQVILQQRPEWLDARIQLGMARYLAGDVATAAGIWQQCRDDFPSVDRIAAYLAMVERIAE